MTLSARAYLSAGVAVIGAGAMALTPVQPLPAQTELASKPAVQNLSVQLAAAVDPGALWDQTLVNTAKSFQQALGLYLQDPLPLFQAWSANQRTYLSELPNIGLIAQQIFGNIGTLFTAPFSPGACVTATCGKPPVYAGEFISPLKVGTSEVGPVSQRDLYQLLQKQPGTSGLADFNFLASPASGQLAGLIGPFLSPGLVMFDSGIKIFNALYKGDYKDAALELINIPAYATNAVVNGYGFLDLTDWLGGFVSKTTTKVGLQLGGLLGPVVPWTGTVDKPTSAGGGTFWDAVGLTDVAEGTTVIDTPGLPVGLVGAGIGMLQDLGQKLRVTKPTAAATVPAAAAAVEAPAAEAPAEVEAPVVPDVTETAPADDAPAAQAAPSHRGGKAGAATGDNGGSNDGGSSNGGSGHRGSRS